MWLDPESNRGHEDFQSSALPTELSSLKGDKIMKTEAHSRKVYLAQPSALDFQILLILSKNLLSGLIGIIP